MHAPGDAIVRNEARLDGKERPGYSSFCAVQSSFTAVQVSFGLNDCISRAIFSVFGPRFFW